MLTIATYNLRNLFDAGVRMGYGSDITIPEVFVDGVVDELAKVITSIDPDILVVQEVASEKVLRRIAVKLPGTYEVFVAPPDTRGIGNAALARVPAKMDSTKDVNGFPVTVVGDEDVIGKSIVPSREFVHIEARYNDRPLHIYGVHLKASSGYPLRKSPGGERITPKNQQEESDAIIRASVFRLAQAKRLRELADKHFSEDQNAQVVILGDFNALEYSDIVKAISGTKSFPDFQLHDLCENVPKEDRYSFIGSGGRILLDHVVVTKSIKDSTESLTIHNDEIVDQTTRPETDFYSSDHAPVVLKLK